MPIVPVIQQNTSDAPPVQAPGVAPMHNFAPEQAQQAGATMERAGLMAMETQQRIQAHLDDANVKAAETKFIQAASSTVNDYSAKRGADAINGYDDAAGSLVKAKKDILDSLNNDVQKHIFNQVAQRHLVTIGSQMSQHRAQQTVEYSANQSFSRSDSMRSAAQMADIGSPDQDTLVNTGIEEVFNGLRVSKGIPRDSEEAQKAERLYRSQIVSDNVSRLMEKGDYTNADAYLTKEMQANHVEGDTGDRLRRAVRGNLLRTQNIEQSDKIFAPYAGKQLRADDLSAMLETAGKIENPEQRQHVEDMVRAKFNEQHTIQGMAYRDNLNDVVNQLASNGGNVRKVDPVKWGQLDDKDRADLMPKPAAVQTDLNTWYKFVTQPDTLTLDSVNEAFAKGQLTKGDWKNFTEMTVRKNNKPDYVQEASAISDRIDYFANQSGLNVYSMKNGVATPQTGEDKAQHGALTMAVQNEIDRVKAQNHGKITSDEVDKIIKKELTQRTLSVTFPRSSWSPLKVLGLSDSYSEQTQKMTYQMPQGATHVAPGSDGKMHYTDGTNDLGPVQ